MFWEEIETSPKYDCHFGKYTTDWCTTTCPKSSLIITGGCCVVWNGIKWYTIKDMCLKRKCMWVCETWVWYTILHNQDQSCVKNTKFFEKTCVENFRKCRALARKTPSFFKITPEKIRSVFWKVTWKATSFLRKLVPKIFASVEHLLEKQHRNTYIALWESMICPKMAMLSTSNK